MGAQHGSYGIATLRVHNLLFAECTSPPNVQTESRESTINPAAWTAYKH